MMLAPTQSKTRIEPCLETIAVNPQELLKEIQKLDKVELHLHLGGAWPIDYLRQIAEPSQFVQLINMLDQIERGVDYHKVFDDVFPLIGQIVNTEKKVEDGIVALCKELSNDNVIYAEFRTSLKDFGSGLESHLKAVLSGIKKGISENPKIEIGLILSLKRDSSEDYAKKIIELIVKYQDQGVIGIDLSGDSTKGDGSQIFPLLIRARLIQNIPLTLHIGESKEESPAQQMKELQKLHPNRIGHAALLSEEAKKWVREKNIPVEMCLTSALKVGMVNDLKDHWALELLRDGHPVAICTDDPLIFRRTLSQECAEAAKILSLSIEKIKSMQEVRKYTVFLMT